MRFAIYSRKSVLTDRGESVENQVELCRRCLAAQYPDVQPAEIAYVGDSGTDILFAKAINEGFSKGSSSIRRRIFASLIPCSLL